jgi:hypothetical protein
MSGMAMRGRSSKYAGGSAAMAADQWKTGILTLDAEKTPSFASGNVIKQTSNAPTA